MIIILNPLTVIYGAVVIGTCCMSALMGKNANEKRKEELRAALKASRQEINETEPILNEYQSYFDRQRDINH